MGAGEDHTDSGLQERRASKVGNCGMTSGGRLGLKTQLEEFGDNAVATGSHRVF